MQEVDSTQILNDEQPQVIEVTLEQFDELVLDKKRLDALLEMKEFQSIIMEKYCTHEFERLSGLLKSPNVQARRDRDIIVEKIAAIGHLETWLKQMEVNLQGIDNPEQRLELLRQIEEFRKSEEEGDQ